MAVNMMGDLANKELEASPESKLVCPKTGKLLGYEYRWNTGETAILWIEANFEQIVRLPLANRARPHR